MELDDVFARLRQLGPFTDVHCPEHNLIFFTAVETSNFVITYTVDMALGSTQPLTEMSTRNISWGVKAAGT
jgi:hypothetical protein